MGFKERLKQLREENTLSQLKMGKDIKISNVTLSQYENGIRKPDIDTLQLLASYFNVTTDYLLGKTNDRTSTDSDIISDLTEEEHKQLIEYVKFLKSQRKSNI